MPYVMKGKPRQYFKWVDGVNDKPIGTIFRGIFIENGEDVFKREGQADKPTFHAIFEDEDGKRVQVSCPSVLQGMLAEAERGMDISIEFVGYLPKKKAGQSPAKDFKVTCNNREAPEGQEEAEDEKAPF